MTEDAMSIARRLINAPMVTGPKQPEPPMRRIRYMVGHAMTGGGPDNYAYFTNLRAARAYAWEEVGQHLEAYGAYDDNGKRYPVGHPRYVALTREEGGYKYRLSFGMGGGTYIVITQPDDDLYFDDNGDVFAKESKPEGGVAWVEVDTSY